MQGFKNFLILLFKGWALGGSNIIPGVSGATLAFILGLYDELLQSIGLFDKKAIKLLFTFNLKPFWLHINGNFLATTVLGIVLGFYSLSNLILYLSLNYPIESRSFFFGLIAISSIIIIRKIKERSLFTITAFLAGLIVAYFMAIATPSQPIDAYWWVFLSGGIVLGLSVLPGISGLNILLILGQFEKIFSAFRELNILVIVIFTSGSIIGIFLFVRLISYGLRNYKQITVSVLSGLLLGSMIRIWPWKIVTQFRLNRNGQQIPAFDRNVWPNEYMELTGQSPLIFQAILFVCLGILIGVAVEKLGPDNKNNFKK